MRGEVFTFMLLAFTLAKGCQAAKSCGENFGGCDKSHGLCWEATGRSKSTFCTCKAGYTFHHPVSKRGNCVDIDECKTGAHGCDTVNGKCVNTNGSHKCRCNRGYQLDYTKTKCLETSKITGLCGRSSSNVEDKTIFDSLRFFLRDFDLARHAPSCKCETGYELRHGCEYCQDVDECKRKISKCDAKLGRCHNTIGGYFCSCRTGYVLGPCGFTCYGSASDATAAVLLRKNSNGLNDEASIALVLDDITEKRASKGFSNGVFPTLENKGCSGKSSTTQKFDINRDGAIDVTIRFSCRKARWEVTSAFDSEARWNPWTCWTECKPTCHGGIQTRSRYCRNGLVGEGRCAGAATEYKTCYHGKKCPVRVRRNANTLSQAQKADFLQAFKKYKADKTTNGFWSAAGTHFYPSQCLNPNTGGPGPCCYHGARTNFIFWHRAELLNFEEGLTRYLRDKTLGLPYWNWLRDNQPPSLVWTKTINGKPNPFANMTIRSGVSPQIFVQRSAQPNKGTIDYSRRIFKATNRKMIKAHAIHQFSEELENAHNGIHSSICHGNSMCRFSMRSLQYAAFDPIFFFHHTNVDRLFTVLQKRMSDMKETAWTRQTALEPHETIYHFNEPYNPFRNRTLTAFKKLNALSSLQDLYFHKELLGYRYDTLDVSDKSHDNERARPISSTDMLYIMQFEKSIGVNVKIFYFLSENGRPTSCRRRSTSDKDFMATATILGARGERRWESKQPLLLPIKARKPRSEFFTNARDNLKITACYTHELDCEQSCSFVSDEIKSKLPSPQLTLFPKLTRIGILKFEWEDGERMPGWSVNVKSTTQWIYFWGKESNKIVQVPDRSKFSSCSIANSYPTPCVHSSCVLQAGYHYFIHSDVAKCNRGLKLSILSLL